MSGDTSESSGGILILRSWVEGEVLRVRITQVIGRTERPVTQVIGRTERPVTAVATVDEACETVRHWLEELILECG
ncbi:hypothetical protein ABGB18_05265 [Nonomuraea sp. B12E4]|uniref:hypothetical protein n=1 Tax=Nonomuraea sp. B12E4 TaxID=3153564 RepID=UPI00325DD5CB